MHGYTKCVYIKVKLPTWYTFQREKINIKNDINAYFFTVYLDYTMVCRLSDLMNIWNMYIRNNIQFNERNIKFALLHR